MRFLLAFLLFAHGVAHLVGFVSSWKLATLAELPYSRFVLAAVIASLMSCVVGWPDARIGVAVNVALVLLLAIGARLNLAVITP